MAFLVNQNLSLVLYPKNFPHKVGLINALKGEYLKNINNTSEWQILATINELTKENSVGNISLKPINSPKCICGKDMTQYCLLGNKVNGDLIFLGFDCLRKYFSDSPLFQEYKLSRRLIRKCKNCGNKFLITEMVGKCCNSCKNYQSSNYFGCISCLSYEKGIKGSQQCINCQIAKRPYFQIKKFSGNLEKSLEEVNELVYNGSNFDLVIHYDLKKELKSFFDPTERCIQCSEAINFQEQLRIVPIDQLQKCIRCVYPNHGRCIACNKFLPEVIEGKDKCLTCFKKFMRSQPKRKCDTCGLMEIPNISSNINKTQCYSCWKKNQK